jgi:glycosyltransferase involved in cell wall biosynthesis
MRIALISTPFVAVPPNDYGGTELVVYELAEGLVRRGHDVVLFATGDSSSSAKLYSFYPQRQWPPTMLADLNHVSWALQQVRSAGDFDVVHAHSAAALAMGRLIPNLPLVYTLHHERDEQLSAFYRHFRDEQYIAISSDQADREIPLRKCEVIHHGLNPDNYQWCELAGDYVVFMGRFSRVKGTHTAIDAARLAGVPIRVAGEIHDVDRDYGDREVLPRLVQPHVSYLGCVGMGVKVPMLREARALLFPIEWNEPFGLVMIEAMLCGCPVVAFPRGSVPEVVEPGVTGVIVESMEEMAEAVRPGGLVDGIDRRRCRERAVERFGRDRMIRDHESLYGRMAGFRRRRAAVVARADRVADGGGADGERYA